jgi:hypothetical protein
LKVQGFDPRRPRVIPHALEQDGLAHPSHSHQQRTLGRQASSHSFNGDLDGLPTIVAAGQLGRCGPRAG